MEKRRAHQNHGLNGGDSLLRVSPARAAAWVMNSSRDVMRNGPEMPMEWTNEERARCGFGGERGRSPRSLALCAGNGSDNGLQVTGALQTVR